MSETEHTPADPIAAMAARQGVGFDAKPTKPTGYRALQGNRGYRQQLRPSNCYPACRAKHRY
jgi:hypothetical protein